MTLKEKLDAVWDHEHIASALNFVKWNDKREGRSSFFAFGIVNAKVQKRTTVSRPAKRSRSRQSC